MSLDVNHGQNLRKLSFTRCNKEHSSKTKRIVNDKIKHLTFILGIVLCITSVRSCIYQLERGDFYLDKAKTQPFMDPKQDKATNTGTATEKFPNSRSAKVCDR